jgi:hypothetical protein
VLVVAGVVAVLVGLTRQKMTVSMMMAGREVPVFQEVIALAVLVVPVVVAVRVRAVAQVPGFVPPVTTHR